ncbi:MAG: hypothetical protein ACYT04_24625 [Nostoc sp.]
MSALTVTACKQGEGVLFPIKVLNSISLISPTCLGTNAEQRSYSALALKFLCLSRFYLQSKKQHHLGCLNGDRFDIAFDVKSCNSI